MSKLIRLLLCIITQLGIVLLCLAPFAFAAAALLAWLEAVT